MYHDAQVDRVADLYLNGAGREKLDPILDACVQVYIDDLDEDGQVDFKAKAKEFIRTYSFLSTILPYSLVEWEKLSMFLNFLVPKLPAPREEDLSRGILESIDMDSYRVEVRAAMSIVLADEEAEIEPAPAGGAGHTRETELERLSSIIRAFNEQFGNIAWEDKDRLLKFISEELPAKVAQDQKFQNAMKNSDRQNARLEHDRALKRAANATYKDQTQFYKVFTDNPAFARFVADVTFQATYKAPGA